MRCSAFLVACLFTVCQAETYLYPGTTFTSISERCTISEEASVPYDMLIWPDKQADLNQIETEINAYFDGKPPAYTNYTSNTIGLIFWEIVLNDRQACDIANLAGVSSVEVDGIDPDVTFERPTGIVQRAPAFATQTQALTELRILSQPTSVPELSGLQNYVFDDKAGSGVYIYILDDGINTEPIDLNGRVAPNPILAEHRQDENDLVDRSDGGHSTCTASKACGLRFGVAKSATCIAVKTSGYISDLPKIWNSILDDINTRDGGIRKKAVINYSQSKKPPANGVIPDEWLSAANLMELIMDLDVPIVASAANHGQEEGRTKQIDAYPQRWSKDTFPIINVGSTKFDGRESGFSQNGPALAVSAPGEGITCSPGTGDGDPVTDEGTSFSAPQVAGLLAYFLSLETVPFGTADGTLSLNALNFLKNTASWSRTPSGPKVAWNLVTEDQNRPST